MTGSLVFTDTLDKTFTEFVRQTAPDVTVRPVQSDAAKASGDSNGAVTADMVENVAALPGVDRANGWSPTRAPSSSARTARWSAGAGAPGLAGNYDDTPAADGAPIVTIVQGSPPDGPGQLLLDEKTAATAGYALGDTVRLVLSGDQPAVTGTLVGTLRLGQSGNLVGATLVQMDTRTAQQWYLRGLDGFHQIAVSGDGSVPNRQQRDAVAAALPPGIEALATSRSRPKTGSSSRKAWPSSRHSFYCSRRWRWCRLLPDSQHLLDHRRPAHPPTRALPCAWRDPAADHPVGAAGGVADQIEEQPAAPPHDYSGGFDTTGNDGDGQGDARGYGPPAMKTTTRPVAATPVTSGRCRVASVPTGPVPPDPGWGLLGHRVPVPAERSRSELTMTLSPMTSWPVRFRCWLTSPRRGARHA